MFCASWSEDDRDRLFLWRLLLVGVGVVLWARINLLDSPRPWFDEGLSSGGEEYCGAWYLRHPTCIGPFCVLVVRDGRISAFAACHDFQDFGATLEAARWMMVAFLVGTVLLAGLSRGDCMGDAPAFLPTCSRRFLPCTGMKNVLGEVPGLFFCSGQRYFSCHWNVASAHGMVCSRGRVDVAYARDQAIVSCVGARVCFALLLVGGVVRE